MKKVFIFAVAMLFSVFLGQAQDIKQAKNAIDAEQYEVAKKYFRNHYCLKTHRWLCQISFRECMSAKRRL